MILHYPILSLFDELLVKFLLLYYHIHKSINACYPHYVLTYFLLEPTDLAKYNCNSNNIYFTICTDLESNNVGAQAKREYKNYI